MRYGKWPHEVAALPFHYYLALRQDWIAANTAPVVDEDDGHEVEAFDINAESLKGEAV